MLNIALYGNDAYSLEELESGLLAQLRGASAEFCRTEKLPLSQTRLYEPPFDLCILDISDNEARGIEFARRLRGKIQTELIFLASGPGFAMEAFNLDALSYLLKPVDIPRLTRIILRRLSPRGPVYESPQFSFKTQDGVRVLSAERIVYVEYSDHKLNIYTDLGQIITTTSMRASFAAAAARLLEDGRFVRTHASFIVNIMHISEFGQSVLTMDNGAAVPVSHAKRREVREQFTSFFQKSQYVL